MATYETSTRLGNFGVGSLTLGLMGLVFFWWIPLGVVFALSGLVLGLAGYAMRRGTSRERKLIMTGLLISGVSVVLNAWMTWGPRVGIGY